MSYCGTVGKPGNKRRRHTSPSRYRQGEIPEGLSGFECLAGNKWAASGVDRQDARSYQENLKGNVEALATAVKEGKYRAKLVLRRYIPKLNGKMRPLSITAIADKVLQIGVSKLLEAIYEQDFLGCSYGYRPGVGAFEAVRELSAVLRSGRYHYLVEADIRGFFDHIDHEKLIGLLVLRIDDKPFLKLIRKWLKAGILEPDGEVNYPEKGSPQGGLCKALHNPPWGVPLSVG
jgi:RNA-directed DNA polymerase